MSSKKFCTKCGNELDIDDSFCEKCGNKVKKNKGDINLSSLKCPNCRSDLIVDENEVDSYYCEYCKSKIIISGLSDAAYKAKTDIKNMKHDEVMADKKLEHEKYKTEQKQKEDKRDLKIAIIMFLVGLSLILTISLTSSNSSRKEEQRLEQIVSEVREDIKNKDFDSAYIKAKSIKYTSGLSDEIEEKWDETRKELINQIIEAEKKETGSSNHKPEKSGFFDNLFK